MSDDPTLVLMPDWWLAAVYLQDKKLVEKIMGVRLVSFDEWMEHHA